jgi:polyisoprenyl-phosphate glycosyltransferase
VISVVIPAYNEAGAVGEAVRQIERALVEIEHEVVVVDDGSQDATADEARAAGGRVVQHPHNLGYGAALKTGIQAATYDTIVITDADGTYPNDYIPVLVKELARGFNMVVGARQGSHFRDSVLKSPMRMILKFLVEFTAGRQVPDVNSGFRAFSKKEVMTYFPHLCNTFSFTTSLTLAYMMTFKFVTYVSIPYYRRVGSTKVRLFRDTLRTLQYIIQAILYYNPLKMFLLLSALMVCGSALSFSLGAVFRLTSGFYLGIGGILMAVQVFCFGLLAELLRQILDKQ